MKCEHCDSEYDYVVMYESDEDYIRSETRKVCKAHFQELFEDNKAVIEVWTKEKYERES